MKIREIEQCLLCSECINPSEILSRNQRIFDLGSDIAYYICNNCTRNIMESAFSRTIYNQKKILFRKFNEKYIPYQYWQQRGENYQAPGEILELPEVTNLKKIVCLFANDTISFLEVGSGYGRIYTEINTMAPIPTNYTMCDFVDSMRQKCLSKIGILPDKWDGRILPYSDNQFDFVISFSVLLHVPPSDIDKIIAEHARVCKKHFFIATHAGGLDRLAIHCFDHDYYELFKKHGLKIIDEKFFRNGLRANWLLKKEG